MAQTQIWSTGPADIYVGTRAAGNTVIDEQPARTYYFGTAEVAPIIHIIPQYRVIRASRRSLLVPRDRAWAGETGLVLAKMTRYNEEVLAMMQSRPIRDAASRGLSKGLFRGTLMQIEGYDLILWVKFTYADVADFQGMPAGYRFLSALLTGPDKMDPIGTDNRAVFCSWQAIEWENSTDDDLQLYDHDMSGLPPPD